jgi:hypothetical protein
MSDGDGSSRPPGEKQERAGDDEVADASHPKVADKRGLANFHLQSIFFRGPMMLVVGAEKGRRTLENLCSSWAPGPGQRGGRGQMPRCLLAAAVRHRQDRAGNVVVVLLV